MREHNRSLDGAARSRARRRRRRNARFFLAALLSAATSLIAIFAVTPPAGADPLDPLGASWQVNAFTTGYQGVPRIAMDDTDAFTVVWNSTSFSGGATQDGSGSGLFGQRYDAASAPIGGEWQVNVFTTADQLLFGAEQIFLGGTITFAVTWADSGGHDGHGFGTFLQVYEDGVPESPTDLQVNTETDGNQAPSDVFVAPDDIRVVGGVCFEGPDSGPEAATEVYCRTGIYGSTGPYGKQGIGGDRPLERQLQSFR